MARSASGRSPSCALQATGIYDIQFGVVPAGRPAPAPGTTPITVEIDFDDPASKFSDASGYFVFVDGDFTVYLEAGFPDHPAFEHCALLGGGVWASPPTMSVGPKTLDGRRGSSVVLLARGFDVPPERDAVGARRMGASLAGSGVSRRLGRLATGAPHS